MNEGQPKGIKDTHNRAEVPLFTGDPNKTVYNRNVPSLPTVPTDQPTKTVINGAELRAEIENALSKQADPDESLTLGGSPEPTDSEIG